MAQEFTIKSEDIESKINQLLPTQGGFQPGVDFSASTMVVPIVDLTETAEGSSLRQDLQSSLSFNSSTAFDVQNTTTTILNTTGYYRVFGGISLDRDSSSGSQARFIMNNGTTDKNIYLINMDNISGSEIIILNFDFVIFLPAGHSFKILANNNNSRVAGCTRQLADLDGNLTDPT